MSDEPEPGAGDPQPQGEAQRDALPPDDTGRSTFRRARQDRYLGGVAGGAGRLFDIDPLVFRLGFAVATVWWRITPLVYAALWLTIREEGAERALLASIRRPGGLRRVASIVILGIGGFVAGPGISDGDGGQIRLGLLLLAVGALLVVGGQGGRGPDQVSYRPSGTSTGPPRPGWPGRPLSTFASGPPKGSGRGWRGRREPEAPKPPASLGWIGLWLVVLLGGAALLLDRSDVSIRPGLMVSVALLIVGAGLLIGAVRGRAHLLIPVGVLLAPLWLAFSLGAVPRHEGDGRVTHAPEAGDDLKDRYTHGYGQLRLDLTELSWADGETREVELGLTAGVTEVWVPSDVEVELDAAIGLGAGEVLHRWEGENAFDLDSVEPDFWLGHGTLSLDAPARPATCETYYLWDGDQPSEIPSDPAQEEQPAEEGELVREDPDGRPCPSQPAPENPAAVKLDVQIGIGYVEVRHVETPA